MTHATNTLPTPDLAHWSRYWQAGARTSLPADFAGNYDGELAQFWTAQFARLPAAARLLDVCCGNGPIALLAARHSVAQDAHWTITAVDAAELDPQAIARAWPDQAAALAHITFTGGIQAETLPDFEPPMDLITSQYGLEYCDLSRAAPRLWVNLTPGGHLAMVSHAVSSEVLRTMQAEQRDYQTLEDSGVLRVLRSWQRNQLADGDFVARLHKVGRSLSAQRPRSALFDSVLQALSALLNMPVGQRHQTRQQAGEYRAELLAARQRAADLLAVMERVADEAWLQPLTEIGFELISSQAIEYQGQHAVGTARVWQRPSAKG